eukprot:g7930.t1
MIKTPKTKTAPGMENLMTCWMTTLIQIRNKIVSMFLLKIAAVWILCCGLQPPPLSATAVLLQNSLAVLLLLLWLLLLLLCIFLPAFSASVFAEFYTTGALVFGGGPVVLPLLDKKLVSTNRITPQEFLAGLSLGQAIPGPMFNLGTYLGALCLPGGNVWAGAVFGCLGLFSPGVLLIFGFYPFWKVLREKSDAYQIKG